MRHQRDSFGLRRIVYDDDGHTASSVQGLLRAAPGLPRDVDVEALGWQLDRKPDLSRTFLRAAREVPPGHAIEQQQDGAVVVVDAPLQPVAGDLPALLSGAVSRAVHDATARGQQVAVALSGGLDSAMVLAWARACGDVPAYVLAPRWSGYSEVEGAVRTAALLGGNLKVVDVDAGDFLAALPSAVKAMEVPIYNAHPVSKLLLARAMRADGVDVALTGDGADHVMKRDQSTDYLPLVQALFDDAGVAVVSPFLDDDVIAHLLTLPPDPDKKALRAIADALSVPRALVTGPKTSRLAPPLDTGAVVGSDRIAALGRLLRRSVDVDADKMLWSTAALLLEQLDLLP